MAARWWTAAGWEWKGDHRTAPSYWGDGRWHLSNHPVIGVTWYEAYAFCEWLSGKENLRYRLPTEAEWEYACRATSAATCSFGDRQKDIAWCCNAEDATLLAAARRSLPIRWSDDFTYPAPAGSFLPNAWGLYDMHGNVSEWCLDWYDARDEVARWKARETRAR